MAKITLFWSDKSPADSRPFVRFVQGMMNRLIVGHWRHNSPDRRKRYLSRLKAELAEYKRTGNAEHLYNIANYALLESIAPEHGKFHYDDKVESVTMKGFGDLKTVREGD